MTKKELYRVLERTALKQPNLAAEIEQLVLMVEAAGEARSVDEMVQAFLAEHPFLASCMRDADDAEQDPESALKPDGRVFPVHKPFAAEILDEARRMHKSGRLESRAMRAMERGWAAFDKIFASPVPQACLIHGDLNVMNIMTDKKLHLTAIIDPLESKWADPEYELFQLRNLTGNCFKLYETYKRKYPVSENCDVKTAFYALYHEVYTYILTGSRIHWYLPQMVRRFEKDLRRAGL